MIDQGFPKLESSSNPRVKDMAALGKAGRKRRSGLVLLEGWNLLEEAARSGARFGDVFALDAEEPLARLSVLLANLPVGVERPKVFAVAEPILKKISTTASPQPVAASAWLPERPWLPEGGGSGLFCGLWNVADPGNLGAAIRVSEAAGAQALLSFGQGVDPWSPKALRASAGSALRLPVAKFAEEDLARVRDEAGARVFALAAREGRSLWEADLASRPVLLLLGNESHGLSAGALEAADEVVHLPLGGPAESLNVATAAAAALFEAARQRALAKKPA